MSKKIAIVDDSKSVREMVAAVLSKEGYEVITADDGKDGLRKLKSKRISLVISDINMPSMDGFTFVKNLKQMPEHKYTPAIMLSTEDSRKAKDMGKEAGAMGWIVKPISQEQLVKAVGKILAD